MEIKISQLTAASTATPDDVFMILQDGGNKKTTLTTILKNLNSYDDIFINPLQNAIRTSIASKNNPKLFYADGVNDKIGIGTSSLSSHLVTIAGSISYGNASSDGILVGSSEEVQWNNGDLIKNLSVVRESSYLFVQAGFAGSYALADGFDGQTKSINLLSTSSGTTSVTLSGIDSSFTQINFTTKGQGILLKYKSSGSVHGWVIIGNNGCTIS